MQTHNKWDIPALRDDRLARTIPTRVYAGGVVNNPGDTLFLWRSCATEKAQGGTLAFFLDDVRLEALWKAPERYSEQFVKYGIGSLVEVDFSLWVNDPLPVQLFNVYRQRSLARHWQEAGLRVVPCLNWSDERSFEFCFQGVPVGCPLVFVECRTPGGNDDDRRAFLRGLTQAVKQVQPQSVLVYGGREHSFWLTERLPKGPTYTLLDSWTSARGKLRAKQERLARAINQPELFTGGEIWVDEAQQAAA
jgi:hypothetical protein